MRVFRAVEVGFRGGSELGFFYRVYFFGFYGRGSYVVVVRSFGVDVWVVFGGLCFGLYRVF